jgi:hypothetical protein
MRIFWLNGGLTLRPDTQQQEKALETVRSLLEGLLFTDGMKELNAGTLGSDHLNNQEPIIESSEFGHQNLKEVISGLARGNESGITQDFLSTKSD